MPRIDLYLTVLPTKNNETFDFMIVHANLQCRFCQKMSKSKPPHLDRKLNFLRGKNGNYLQTSFSLAEYSYPRL